jgi:hypothetical protein
MLHRESKILTLDIGGMPRKWVDIEHAAEYYAKDKVAWEVGEYAYTLRGGIQRITGIQSEITVRSIIAIKGTDHLVGKEMKAPLLSRRLLFQRDRCLCCYCNTVYEEKDLEMEHVVPVAQGGKTNWMNIVTSCYHCNDIKGNRTPEQAGMDMYYAPFTPSRSEGLLLMNRHILADQMELLMSQSRNIAKYPRIPRQK